MTISLAIVADASETARRIAADLDGQVSRTVPALRQARRRWSAMLRTESPEAVVAIATALIGTSVPRFVTCELVLHHRGALALVDAAAAARLAAGMDTWGDVDAFGTLIAGPAWLAGGLADEDIHEWSTSDSRWWRRAALVATTGLNVPNRGGLGDTARTLAVCERLVRDRDDMVVKALSWALRELCRHDAAAVAAFVEEHSADIAPRVRREVASKLATGRKSRRS